jgi:tRNA1(Val) A37 N6-methylase TrmN6
VSAEPDADERLSCDALLGGRVRLLQPRRGYRAATDPVLLAAACTASAGERVLDAGCGVGAAGLCLAARVPGVVLTGLEIQPHLAALAVRNAALNQAAMTVIEGDLADTPRLLRPVVFDHVVTNPPFFDRASHPSPEPSRDIARRAGPFGLREWIEACLRRLRQGGWLTVIHRAEGVPALLAACEGRAGSIAVRPLAAREGRGARRVLMQARKDSRGPFRLCPPFVLHEGAKHRSDGDDFTAAATAVLRDGAPLAFPAP